MSIDHDEVVHLRSLGWTVREIARHMECSTHAVYDITAAYAERIKARMEDDHMKAIQRRCGWSTKAVGARIAARRESVL